MKLNFTQKMQLQNEIQSLLKDFQKEILLKRHTYHYVLIMRYSEKIQEFITKYYE